MEPHSSDEPSSDISTIFDTISAETRITASAVNARPQPTQSTLLMVGAAGTFTGIVIVLALVWLRGETTPVHTAPATKAPVVTSTPPPVIVESAPAPTWTGQRQATWGYDGTKTITFELQATSDVPIWMSRARPLLVVRCLARETQAFVVLGTSVAYETDDYHRTIHLQWDDGPAIVQQWEGAESGQELFAPDGVTFVRQLARTNRLRFGFTPFNAKPVTAEFAVQGFDALAGLVASTCRWRLDA